MKHVSSLNWLAIQTEAIATFLIIFIAHMHILYIIKVKRSRAQ